MLVLETAASMSASSSAASHAINKVNVKMKAEKLSSLLHGGTDIDDERLAAASTAALGWRERPTEAQLSCVKSTAAAFRKDMNLLLNLEFRLETLKAKHVTLNEGGTPAEVKPYKSPTEYECADLVSPFAGTTISIVVPADATHAEVR